MAELRGIEGRERIRSHTLHMDNRELMSVTGIKDVMSFNEEEVVLQTESGELCVSGDGLHITKLSLEEGHVVVEGEICAIEYEESRAARGSLLSRMFR